MNFTRSITQQSRSLYKQLLQEIPLDQLNKIPEGFSNNIFWNVAHVVVTQQLLVYKLSGLPMYISDELTAKYRNKTKPEGDVTQEEVDEMFDLLDSLITNIQ